jgi:tyrosinase
MADDRIYITGVTDGAYNRLELNNFINHEKYFSLYIQALQIMLDADQKDLKSFFQIGGIHGLPYTVWDESFGDTFAWGGYCTHGSVLFPTWHRPYVLLYEQVLQSHAVTIAATYTVDGDDWKQAAKELRQPYWDWAKNSVPPPQVVQQKRVTIVGSDGYRTVVDNPLYRYTFDPIDRSFPGPYCHWQTTLRHPTSRESTAVDNVLELEQSLRREQQSLTDDVYIMLTEIHDWPGFSNHTTTQAESKGNSLESIHDKIHVLVGGAGQMGDPAVAGFDPIFFLHHANVDRLLSLWAALNFTVWVTPGNSEDGTLTIAPGVTIDQETGLTPFWKKEATYWTSNGLQNTTPLGYTYPEFNGLEGKTPEAIQTEILKKVDELYGDKVLIGLPGKPINDHTPLYDWFAHVEFRKYELGCSFSLLFFLGEVPENPKLWSTSPNFVNSCQVFVNSASGRCANCRNKVELLEEGYVRLNRGIDRKLKQKVFDPAKVEEYLKDNKILHWRVQKTNGEPALLTSLKVTIYRTSLKEKISPGGTVTYEPKERSVVLRG